MLSREYKVLIWCIPGSLSSYHSAWGQMGFKDTLNQKAKNTVSETVKSTVEIHNRKQVQMYTVVRHLAKTFERNAPTKFRECFKCNRCYYTKFDGEHDTVEQFVPGPLLSR